MLECDDQDSALQGSDDGTDASREGEATYQTGELQRCTGSA